MNGYDVVKKYNNKEVIFCFCYANGKWYIGRNDILDILFNPATPSSYWRHLKQRFLLEGIDIELRIKNIRIMSKDNKRRIKKALTIKDAINLISIIDESAIGFINWLNEVKIELNDMNDDIYLERCINNYLKRGISSTEIKNKINKILDTKIIRLK